MVPQSYDMPTPKLSKHERRRCVKACSSCKRRKERCDGLRPCGRCSTRGVGQDCSFARPPPASISPMTNFGLGFSPNSHDKPDPTDPSPNPPSPGSLSTNLTHGARQPSEFSPSSHVFHSPRVSPVPQLSRLIQDCHGKPMCIGNAANLSFLQVIRRIAHDSLGYSRLPDEPPAHSPPQQSQVVAAPCSRSTSNWIVDVARQPPNKPDPFEIDYLLWWYLRATNCVFYLFDASQLRQGLLNWLQTDENGHEPDTGTSAVFFLVLAVGAQAAPDDREAIAEQYFNYGRFLTMSHLMEEPAVSTIQANILITVYLLGASRSDAASMYLGTAVRAAYALGVHRLDINKSFNSSEHVLRERLWKVLRILDLFLGASLGRSPSTYETRNTGAEADYSAANDLCSIFEVILTQVYSKPRVSTAIIQRISQYHRQWATRYSTGLANDAIPPGEIQDIGKGKTAPNISFYHLMQAYYWTIMLITRPSLIDSISKHTSNATIKAGLNEVTTSTHSSTQALAHASVDAAIRTVALLHGLISREAVPKRLPIVVNCLFNAALVLGLAQFGDLDRVFPLHKHLLDARTLLLMFSRYDAVARSNLAAVEELQTACDLYLERRERRKMERQSLLFRGLFGALDGNFGAQMPLHRGAAVDGLQQLLWPPAFGPAPVTDVHQSSSSDHSNFLSPVGSETQSLIDIGYGLSDMVPGLGPLSDLILPVSPRTFMRRLQRLGSLNFAHRDFYRVGAGS
ncbi:hypothetical protein B0T10DRAFT_541580 [Thelonectria olida]|uniref:Zn(2)-C6 fungal-type domain-containing protein n=1 Tax=Thelonectria olida TaxID=1576542 RepID=A0A9P8VPH8_9HYPO|nr:hypothetical protein B0T10DRAFT_541580 [Thelonectria olida]